MRCILRVFPLLIMLTSNKGGNDTQIFLYYYFFSPTTLEIDGGFYTVKFDSLLLKDVVVEADSIIPPLREEDPSSSESDVDDAENEDCDAFAKGQCWIFSAVPSSLL